jgi:hypothetical protein
VSLYPIVILADIVVCQAARMRTQARRSSCGDNHPQSLGAEPTYPQSQRGVSLRAARGYDGRMKVCVYPMRQRGRRFPDRNDEGIVGDLRMHSTSHGTEAHSVAQLCATVPLSSREEQLLPCLYSPELIAIGNTSMLLRGFESEDGTAYVQEWRCVIG